MSLYEKIITIYPELTNADFSPTFETILLQNDSDGKGDYIKSWNHPVYPQPTQAQLDGVN